MGTAVYHNVGQHNLQLIADHACRYYRIAPIKIVVYNDPEERSMGEHIWWDTGDGCTVDTTKQQKIRLNRGFHGANVATLLHELAHYIMRGTYEGHESHGKKFVGVYMHLLDKYRIMPGCAFRALAKKCKVQIAGKFKPDAIRA